MPTIRSLAMAVLVVLLVATPAAADTITIPPGTAPAAIGDALRNAAPGSTVVLADGSYGDLDLFDVTPAAQVTLAGASRAGVSVQSVLLRNVANLVLRDMTVRGPPGAASLQARSGVRLETAVRDVTVSGLRITGGARGITVGGAAPGSVSRALIVGNDVSGAFDDLVQVFNSDDVELRGNLLHSPQCNAGHNDAVQLISGRRLRVVGNWIWTNGACTDPGHSGHDQAIILSRSGQPLEDVTIASNLIWSWWGGVSIFVSGATRVDVVGNTAAPDRLGAGGSQAQTGLLVTDDAAQRRWNAGVRIFNNVLNRIQRGPGITFEAANAVFDASGRGGFDVGGSLGTVFAQTTAADRPGFYLPRAGGPADGTGVAPGGPVPADLDGLTRGARPDLGARELPASPATGTPPAVAVQAPAAPPRRSLRLLSARRVGRSVFVRLRLSGPARLEVRLRGRGVERSLALARRRVDARAARRIVVVRLRLRRVARVPLVAVVDAAGTAGRTRRAMRVR